MANRFNDRDREERNYYTSRGNREQGGPQDWRESGNQEGREWYETEQPENSDFESGRYRGSSENRGTRSQFSGQGSERFGRQNWGQEGGGGQYNRSNDFEDYGQRGGGQSFGQGRQSFGQGRSQQGQFQNYGQENWRTHRGSSQSQQYGGGQTGEYGFGGRGQYGGQSGWGGGSTGSQYMTGQSGQYGSSEGSQFSQGQYGQGSQYDQGSHSGQGSQYGQGSQWGQGSQQSGQSGFGQRGQFSGRGPKGYRRSDDRIKEDINERLTHDPEIDAWEIEVQVTSGEVILTGTVDDRNAKRRAEDIAESISGVKDVQNQIRVKKGDEDRGSDFKKDSTFSSELSDKDKDKSSGQGGIKANIK